MKNFIGLALLSLAANCTSIAGVEGTYKASDVDMTIDLLTDGTAKYRLVTPLNFFGSEMTITSSSDGKWTLNDGKVSFQGDVLLTTSAEGQPDMSETKPLVIVFSVEENGDLVVIPSEDVQEPTRLSKQE
jgi:hypothetical protein